MVKRDVHFLPVPFVSALAIPSVFFAGRLAAERATDARGGRIEVLLFLKLANQSDGLHGVSHKTEVLMHLTRLLKVAAD
jgi:hypothetical protein